MDFLSGAITGLTGLLGYYGGKEQNVANIESAREQMAFQERMASTAYQRTMADMKAAGLNPLLAAKLGGGSSPSGSQAQIQEVLGKSAANALEARRLYKELEATDSAIALNKSQVELNKANAIRALSTPLSAAGKVISDLSDKSQSLTHSALEAKKAKEKKSWFNLGK